jgi:hypothetical protein
MESLFLKYYNEKCKNCQLFADCYPWPIETTNVEPDLLELGGAKTEWANAAGYYKEQQILCSHVGFFTPI